MLVRNEHYKNLEDPNEYCLLLEVNTLTGHGQAGSYPSPKGKPLGSHVIDWK